jgi:hypothetical protein
MYFLFELPSAGQRQSATPKLKEGEETTVLAARPVLDC